MKLFLLRHGKATEGFENQKDFDRVLAGKGKKQSKKIGSYLKDTDIKYGLVSPAKRTQQTFDIINEHINIESVYESPDLYLSSADVINDVINQHVTASDILVVGHNFGISDLVDFYTGININLSTCMLAIIEFDAQSTAHFSRQGGRLLEVISPKDL
ncbi:MAG: histidine phosphatase family protein [Crocinitomicaceae bacterium]